MRVIVEYVVPVLCEVDTDPGQIVAVRVVDDELLRTGGVFGEGAVRVQGPDAEKAIAAAERQAWPRWVSGA